MTTRVLRPGLPHPQLRTAQGWGRTALVAVIAAALIALVWLQGSSLQNARFTTGYALYATVVALIALHWRKQAPSLPLGRVSVWLQYHISLGYLAIVLFGLHVALRMPTGILGTALFSVFVIVVGSGLYGLYITRTVPRQLRLLSREAIYEEIPALQRQLAAQARRLIERAADSNSLVELYKTKLAPFFDLRRGLWYFVYPNSRRRRRLMAQLRELDRFVDKPRRNDCRELGRLLAEKDDLDFQAALQGKLKLWTFVHIGFSYSLLLLGLAHGIIAHAFQGGSR
jgi:hypothetical protein